MKKLVIVLSVSLLIYSIYYDLQTGTLPVTKAVAASIEKSTEKSTPSNNKAFIEVKVRPGDTVLSLLEKNQKGSLSVSITTVISDFKMLNNNLAPEKIQIGKTYKIPIYK